jgi:hypothetical protein
VIHLAFQVQQNHSKVYRERFKKKNIFAAADLFGEGLSIIYHICVCREDLDQQIYKK